MKRCFLVTGPESSGNRLMGAILKRAGCETLSGGEDEKPMHQDPVVWVRSFRAWYTPAATFAHLARAGYVTTVLLMSRHPVAMLKSQGSQRYDIRYGDNAQTALCRAYRQLFRDASEWPDIVTIWPVTYESLDDLGSDALCEFLGLEAGSGPLAVPDPFPDSFVNQNAKHFN